MSSYSELIKNFEKIRSYMRDFYVYGFKSRMEYDKKSARSYDDERRRIESWLGDHMKFVRSSEGKNVFLSIDSRANSHNPLYKAWKAKSFTDKDITLHFILFDILHSTSVFLTLPEIIERIDNDYLACFEVPMIFDQSTLRKKLKEYEKEGIIICRKEGNKTFYKRSKDITLPESTDALDFFSEALPCGIIGSYILDRKGTSADNFTFKHHYITGTLDSDVLASLFDAMQKKSCVKANTLLRHSGQQKKLHLVPLSIFISVQSGRQHLIAYDMMSNRINSYRVDMMSDVTLDNVCSDFDALRARLDQMRSHMWGVCCNRDLSKLEHVEFTIRVKPHENYIINRLMREKRCGTVEKIDNEHYRFSADVYDSSELNPWVRTFICRITQMNYSNRTVENRLKKDIEMMLEAYGIDAEQIRKANESFVG